MLTKCCSIKLFNTFNSGFFSTTKIDANLKVHLREREKSFRWKLDIFSRWGLRWIHSHLRSREFTHTILVIGQTSDWLKVKLQNHLLSGGEYFLCKPGKWTGHRFLTTMEGSTEGPNVRAICPGIFLTLRAIYMQKSIHPCIPTTAISKTTKSTPTQPIPKWIRTHIYSENVIQIQ